MVGCERGPGFALKRRRKSGTQAKTGCYGWLFSVFECMHPGCFFWVIADVDKLTKEYCALCIMVGCEGGPGLPIEEGSKGKQGTRGMWTMNFFCV